MPRNSTVTTLRHESPPVPDYLHGAAAALWEPTVRQLIEARSWRPDCMTQTAMYVVALANTRLALANISRDGPVVEASISNVACHSVWRKVLRESGDDCIKLGRTLGLEVDEDTIFGHQARMTCA